MWSRSLKLIAAVTHWQENGSIMAQDTTAGAGGTHTFLTMDRAVHCFCRQAFLKSTHTQAWAWAVDEAVPYMNTLS
jgi:hypothetical protein